MLRKRCVFLFSLTLLILSACMSQEDTVKEKTEEVIYQLHEEAYQQIEQDFFSEALRDKYPAADLQQSWEANRGDTPEEISEVKVATKEEVTVASSEVIFNDATVEVEMRWVEEKEETKLNSLRIQRPPQELTLPDSVTEEEMIIEAEEGYPLKAKLTLPADKEGPFPAVVLVHGSGPSNMDEEIFAYKPFKDIAYGLGEEGIAVLRYDKRTYAHVEKMMEDFGAEQTVNEETIDDAVEAATLLQADERIQADHVYIGGHSLGGMLAPRIDDQAGTAGMIILAGPPRPFWEIIYDQQVNAIPENLSDEAKEKQIDQADALKELLASLQDMPKEEAMRYHFAGMSGYYFHEMAQYDVGQLALDSKKPMLILQGEADFQISAEKDFAAWQSLFDNEPQAVLKSYPNLNHSFILSQGENKGTAQEYEIPGHVDKQVISDISDWIHEQGRNKEKGE